MKRLIIIATASVLLAGPGMAQTPAPALPTFFAPGTLSGADAALSVKFTGASASTVVRATDNSTTGIGSIPMFTVGAGRVSSGAATILAPIGAPSP